jgi:hypothetical protein
MEKDHSRESGCKEQQGRGGSRSDFLFARTFGFSLDRVANSWVTGSRGPENGKFGLAGLPTSG